MPEQTAKEVVEEVKEAPENPVEMEKPVEMAPPVEVEKPAGRPWYKRWWKKSDKGASESTKVERQGKTSDGKAVEETPPELPEAAKGMFSASGEPLIKAGYALKFSVSGSGRVEVADQIKTVSDKGAVSMPLVGIVACEGLTLKELADRLVDLYGKFIRAPLVNVDFVYEGKQGEISPWGAVVVYGLVRQPGMVSIPPTRNLTVSRAIQLTGGAERSANLSKITVSRLQKDGTKKRIVVDLMAVAQGLREKDIKLESGDVINVPESVW